MPLKLKHYAGLDSWKRPHPHSNSPNVHPGCVSTATTGLNAEKDNRRATLRKLWTPYGVRRSTTPDGWMVQLAMHNEVSIYSRRTILL